MPSATERRYAISFIAPVVTTDEYTEPVEDWDEPTTLATVRARVRFGSSQEQRQAAQETASQAATFECLRTATLDAIPMTARISFDGSQWDIDGRSPMSRKDIWFSATRLL
jgi:head-tail adaptor